MILRAGGDDADSSAALAELCRAYWLPLYIYVRRRGYSTHDAEDLTQGFIADLISRGAIRQADPARGRFRSFLLTALGNFLHNAHDRATAGRRGGGVERLSIEAAEACAALVAIETDALTPDEAFDRSWAHALLDRALRRLRAEQEQRGDALWFCRLSPFLSHRPAPGDFEAIAQEFGVTRNAVAVALHRMGARYRTLVQAEVAETVSDAAGLEREWRELLATLSK